MPAALDFSTWVKVSPLEQRKLKIFSENFDDDIEVDLDDQISLRARTLERLPCRSCRHTRKSGSSFARRSTADSWRGADWIGLEFFSGNRSRYRVCARQQIPNLKIDPRELALLCQRAENEFVGARVGIMDQFISLFGQAQKALLLDCRSLEFRLLPLPDNVRLIICNTMVKHALASSAYNERRAQCEAGVKHLATFLPDVTALRDVTIEQLEEHRNGLDDVVYRRCRHVITENARVLSAGDASSMAISDVLGS